MLFKIFVFRIYRPRAYVLHDLCEYIYIYLMKDKAWGFEIQDARFNLAFRAWMEVKNTFYWEEPRTMLTWERFERVSRLRNFSNLDYFLSRVYI